MRLLFALLVAAAAIVVALYFADHPGAVTFAWEGWQVDTSIGVLAFALASMLVFALVLQRLLGFVFGAPSRYARKRRQDRILLGHRAITDGLVALAAGDLRGADQLRLEAHDHFSRARHPVPPLTRLLSAQTALLRDDHAAARQEFSSMLEAPETEFLGLRGLIVQAWKAGDDATALTLVERANRLRPHTAWVLETQFALQTRKAAWADAERTLADLGKSGGVAAAEAARHRLALLLARSAAAEGAGDQGEALKTALAAHSIDPGFAPAAVRAAALLTAAEKQNRARKILETAWAKNPHPGISAQYDRLWANEPTAERLHKLDRLTALHHAPEGHLMAAEVALDGHLWGEARRHLEAAGAAAPGPWPKHLCRLMATLEREERQDGEAAAQWSARSHEAIADREWVCTDCRSGSDVWAPICPACSAFDTMLWQVPALAIIPDRAKLPHPTLLPAMPERLEAPG